MSQGLFEDALSTASSAAEVFNSVGDRHQSGVALVTSANALLSSDLAENAVVAAERALELLDPAIDERAVYTCRFNLAIMLADTGERSRALAELRDITPYYRRRGDKLFMLRLRWAEGQIALDMGHTALAEKALLEARNGFAAAGIGIEASEISLELSLMYLEQRRTLEVQSIAEALVPIFQAQDLHQEAIAAMLVFRRAALHNEATTELVSGILEFLDEVRSNPAARYAAASRQRS